MPQHYLGLEDAGPQCGSQSELRAERDALRESWLEEQEAKARDCQRGHARVCSCPCHYFVGMRHCFPCCHPCPECGAQVGGSGGRGAA